ncbi:type VI secretion system ImpA family N-terminal domain-containing protein [Cereibacter sphaeroides]|uniref:type VI secretion system protein TssA n=1 Tax=Cereibacter sphaeroides TaxID=1063 RepID=UPI001F23D8A0|nr:type VI secretion system ImpA family N-terminal domain-containing protein [Cereibacter sphaeroides]MCE6950761.1 type VI secretion system ImpA family N-terminal domain-containing protein [Cereibacter sphaeroides]
MVELQGFLESVGADHPSGAELRNDARFHAIERLIEPAHRAARVGAAASGSSIQVDWPQVIEDCRELAGSGRDLRLLVILLRALAAEEGLSGLTAGLDLMTETVSRYWDTLHPALREGSPAEAALRRINALRQIENPDTGLLGDLEFLPVIEVRGIGRITAGDLAAAALSRSAALAEAPRGLGQKETEALAAGHEARVNRVAAACRALQAERPEDHARLRDGIAGAIAALERLEAALSVKMQVNGSGPRFLALTTMLQRMAVPLNAPPSDAQSPETPAEPATPTPSGSFRIASRGDVERCLDLIIDFYERTEPSSPIPHLARRMRRMVPMNFLQLMEEVAPSGMKEFRAVAGVVDDRTK